MFRFLSDFKALQHTFSEYISLKIRHAKFEIFEYVAKEKANITYWVISATVFFFLLLFSSLFTAALVNEVFKSTFLGFGFVFLFWFVLAITLIVFKKNVIKTIFKTYLEENIPS